MNKLSALIKLTRDTIPHAATAQKDIDWKLGMTDSERAQTVTAGTDVVFKWIDQHNVWLMPNKAAYDACNFDQARELASESVNEYTYKASAPGTFYFGCKITDHCRFKHKMALTVTTAGQCVDTIA